MAPPEIRSPQLRGLSKTLRPSVSITLKNFTPADFAVGAAVALLAYVVMLRASDLQPLRVILAGLAAYVGTTVWMGEKARIPPHYLRHWWQSQRMGTLWWVGLDEEPKPLVIELEGKGYG